MLHDHSIFEKVHLLHGKVFGIRSIQYVIFENLLGLAIEIRDMDIDIVFNIVHR